MLTKQSKITYYSLPHICYSDFIKDKLKISWLNNYPYISYEYTDLFSPLDSSWMGL